MEPFKKSDTINLKLDYKTSDGKTKKLYTIFHDSVFGFSLGDSNDVYYTIPYKKIKNVLKSNKIHLSSFSEKLSVKNINPITLMGASLVFINSDKNPGIGLIAKTFFSANVIKSDNLFYGRIKNFSFSLSSDSVSKLIKTVFGFDVNSSDDGDYFFDVEIYDHILRCVKCITPSFSGIQYLLEINLKPSEIEFFVKNLKSKECFLEIDFKALEDWAEIDFKHYQKGKYDSCCKFVFSSDKRAGNIKHKEKSIYSLTLGELIKVTKTFYET